MSETNETTQVQGRTPEEWARSIKYERGFVADVADAIRQAVAAEREACARAICAGCREGEDIGQNADGGYMHRHSVDGWAYGCAASAIHQRSAAAPMPPAGQEDA